MTGVLAGDSEGGELGGAVGEAGRVEVGRVAGRSRAARGRRVAGVGVAAWNPDHVEVGERPRRTAT